MNQKVKVVPVGVTVVTLAAVTTAFALSRQPKVETQRSHEVVTSVFVGSRSSAKVELLQNKGDSEAKEGEEKDGEKDNGPLTATLPPEAAKAAALQAQPGTVGKTELENEEGVTVYGIDITAADGKKYDVKVDANTGKVLKSEADDNDGEEDAK